MQSLSPPRFPPVACGNSRPWFTAFNLHGLVTGGDGLSEVGGGLTAGSVCARRRKEEKGKRKSQFSRENGLAVSPTLQTVSNTTVISSSDAITDKDDEKFRDMLHLD